MKDDIDAIWIHYDTNMAGEPFMHASIVENKSFTKYLRAEPVEELLRQAKRTLEKLNDDGFLDHLDCCYDNGKFYSDTLNAINEFLGENKCQNE